MCSVSGAILQRSWDPEKVEHLLEIIKKAEQRGRDSCGIVWLNRDKDFESLLEIANPSEVVEKAFDHPTILNGNIFINNNRAEPTTEYVKDKTLKDVQPFVYSNRFAIAHNGTIANDKELEKKYDLKRETKIDSAIIPPLLEKLWDGSNEGLVKILKEELVGSYALAIIDKEQPDKLFLAVNYKPMYLTYSDKALFFSSLESYLEEDDLNTIFDLNSKTRALKPYSLAVVSRSNGSFDIEEYSLWEKDVKDFKKALVVCSGGLDSTVVATEMKKKGYDVTLLHFMYKARAESKEVEAVKKIAEALDCEALFVETEIFKNVIKHSRLTETKEDLVTEGKGEASAELAWEWVPARNLIFLSIATGIAEGYGFDIIALGNNLEEAGAYPDNEMIFVNKFAEVLPYATNLQKRVTIQMPVGNLMKHEIVKKALELEAPIQYSWSCYNGTDKHCGTCGPCYMRRNAFKMLGQEDMIEYAE